MKTARSFSPLQRVGKARAGFSRALPGLLAVSLLALGCGSGSSAFAQVPPSDSSSVPSASPAPAVPDSGAPSSSASSDTGNPVSPSLSAALSSGEVYFPDENTREPLSALHLSPRLERLANAFALYTEGVNHETSGGLSTAIPFYRETLKEDPTCVPLYLKISLSLLTERRFTEADTLLSNGLLANPDSPSLLAALALTREYEGQLDEALRLAARAKEIAPAHLLAHRVAFEILRDQKKNGDAVKLIRAASATPVEKIPRAQDWAALARLYTELAASIGDVPPPPLLSAASSKAKSAPVIDQLSNLILPFYDKALAIGSPTRDLLRQRGEFSLYLNRKDEAYGYLKRASALDDGNVEIYITLASLCIDLGKNNEALDNYEKAYALQPEFPELWKVLVHLYLTPDAPSLKQTDKAISVLEDVIQRSPTELEAAIGLGDLYQETGQLEKAESNLRLALSLSLASPKTASPIFQLKLALLLMRENRLDETAALLADAEKRFPQSARIPFVEGIVARNRKQSKEAIDYFARARLMAKDQEADLLNGEFYCELSIAQEQAGQIAQSEETLKQGLTVEPENPNLLNALAYLWAEQNRNLNDALKYSRRSMELKPDQGEYMDTLGWIEYRLGQYPEAAAMLQKAADITGNDSTVLGHLADTLVKLGKVADAQKVLQKILEKDPDNVEARQKLAVPGPSPKPGN